MNRCALVAWAAAALRNVDCDGAHTQPYPRRAPLAWGSRLPQAPTPPLSPRQLAQQFDLHLLEEAHVPLAYLRVACEHNNTTHGQ